MFVMYNFSLPNYKPRYFATERGARIAQGRNNKNPRNFQCGVLSLEHFNKLFSRLILNTLSVVWSNCSSSFNGP